MLRRGRGGPLLVLVCLVFSSLSMRTFLGSNNIAGKRDLMLRRRD